MTQTIIASDARLVASDYQTLSQTAVRIRMTRSIVDGQGYEYCSPGARVKRRSIRRGWRHSTTD